MAQQPTRLEHDLLGDKAVPADAYYGVQTARGLENFHISGVELRLYPDLIKALAMVKLAAARANFDCGQFGATILTRHRGRLPGTHRRQAPRRVPARRLPGRRRHVDEHERQRGHRQPGARADGAQEGRVHICDPHDHVNASQSTNDAYPTSLHMGMALGNVRLDRRHERADRGVPRQGSGVRGHPQDGPDAAAGRGADDARPGVRGVRRNAGGRSSRAGSRSSACCARSTWVRPPSAPA